MFAGQLVNAFTLASGISVELFRVKEVSDVHPLKAFAPTEPVTPAGRVRLVKLEQP